MSILRPARPGSCSQHVAAVSGNCVSTTISASWLTSQPIVPPRPVKMPTSRRKGRNSVTGGGGIAVAGRAAGSGPGAEGCAPSRQRASHPAAVKNEERTRKSRRFTRLPKHNAHREGERSFLVTNPSRGGFPGQQQPCPAAAVIASLEDISVLPHLSTSSRNGK